PTSIASPISRLLYAGSRVPSAFRAITQASGTSTKLNGGAAANRSASGTIGTTALSRLMRGCGSSAGRRPVPPAPPAPPPAPARRRAVGPRPPLPPPAHHPDHGGGDGQLREHQRRQVPAGLHRGRDAGLLEDGQQLRRAGVEQFPSDRRAEQEARADGRRRVP